MLLVLKGTIINKLLPSTLTFTGLGLGIELAIGQKVTQESWPMAKGPKNVPWPMAKVMLAKVLKVTRYLGQDEATVREIAAVNYIDERLLNVLRID